MALRLSARAGARRALRGLAERIARGGGGRSGAEWLPRRGPRSVRNEARNARVRPASLWELFRMPRLPSPGRSVPATRKDDAKVRDGKRGGSGPYWRFNGSPAPILHLWLEVWAGSGAAVRKDPRGGRNLKPLWPADLRAPPEADAVDRILRSKSGPASAPRAPPLREPNDREVDGRPRRPQVKGPSGPGPSSVGQNASTLPANPRPASPRHCPPSVGPQKPAVVGPGAGPAPRGGPDGSPGVFASTKRVAWSRYALPVSSRRPPPMTLIPCLLHAHAAPQPLWGPSVRRSGYLNGRRWIFENGHMPTAASLGAQVPVRTPGGGRACLPMTISQVLNSPRQFVVASRATGMAMVMTGPQSAWPRWLAGIVGACMSDCWADKRT